MNGHMREVSFTSAIERRTKKRSSNLQPLSAHNDRSQSEREHPDFLIASSSRDKNSEIWRQQWNVICEKSSDPDNKLGK